MKISAPVMTFWGRFQTLRQDLDIVKANLYYGILISLSLNKHRFFILLFMLLDLHAPDTADDSLSMQHHHFHLDTCGKYAPLHYSYLRTRILSLHTKVEISTFFPQCYLRTVIC